MKVARGRSSKASSAMEARLEGRLISLRPLRAKALAPIQKMLNLS